DNATAGVNVVLGAFPLQPADEILVTDQSYPTTASFAAQVARDRGATVRVVPAPYPCWNSARLVHDVADAIGPHTRLAVFDHVTSETALVFPLAELAACCRARGVAV